MKEIELQDSIAREKALDPSSSFLIQAPAGSGKTGLLVQRFLALLAVVEKPEEILAITFTRKAAAEMRERILSKLSLSLNAEQNLNEYSEHELKIYELAKKAFQRDQELNWGLLQNPSRLQILTIDSFCSRLVSVMPIASGLGGMPNLIDDASELYRSAVNQYFKYFLQSHESDQNFETLLLELNNDFERAANLLVTMLAKRDQWLAYVTNDYLIDLGQLNEALEAAIEQDLASLNFMLSDELNQEIVSMSSYAAESLRVADRDSEIRACQYLNELPRANFESLTIWRGIKKLLLTDKGSIRSRVSIAEGFAPETSTDNPDLRIRYKEFKQRMTSLLSTLKKENKFTAKLAIIADLPDRKYNQDDQKFLNALFSVLKNLTAELFLEFKRTGYVDFIELTQSALMALGYDESPTDLALSFDSRINHILVDEFQDTSRLHYELLRKLTAAWADDNRSLFIVGDPMQSIYRFRDADVKNFLFLKRNGINSIKPDFLQLESNFRSAQNVVNSNNAVFINLFPDEDDVNTGDVAFHPSVAVKPDSSYPSISLNTILANDSNSEAKMIVKLIVDLYEKDKDATIAVLVRSRNHLEKLIPLIRKERLLINIEGMEKLSSRQEVLDVYSLTMALVHPSDRQAWLSILRAPWCGLTLVELEQLANLNKDSLILEILQKKDQLHFLSAASLARVEFLVEAFDIAMMQLHREPLALVIESLWQELNGFSCLETEEQLINVEKFFQILRSHTIDSVLSSVKPLAKFLNEFTSSSESNNAPQLQLLTIHMAKGLEFDHVIIPGASRTTRGNDSELLVWHELVDAGTHRHLMLSQYQPASDNSIYNYVKKRNHRLDASELKRLFYVAMTRSIKSTTVFCESKLSKGEQKLLTPQGSFAHLLAPSINAISKVNECKLDESDDGEIENSRAFKRQFLKNLSRKQPEADVQSGITIKQDIQSEVIEYEWASETAMHIGTVVHLALKQLGSMSVEEWAASDQSALEGHLSRVLRALGVPNTELAMSIERTLKALNAAAADNERSWIFSSEHKDIENEFPVSGFIDGQFKNFRIDRTFIDINDVRWIIDYKTSIHQGGGLNEFLDNEMLRYKLQLENYAVLMKKIDGRKIRLGMYFPLVQGWREWAYAE